MYNSFISIKQIVTLVLVAFFIIPGKYIEQLGQPQFANVCVFIAMLQVYTGYKQEK